MPRKYLYKNKQNVKQTIQIGEITPVFWRRYYGGEKIKELSFDQLTRMITPLYPTLDNPNISLYAFKVPDRLLAGINNLQQQLDLFNMAKQYTLKTNPITRKLLHNTLYVENNKEFKGKTGLAYTHRFNKLFKKFGIDNLVAWEPKSKTQQQYDKSESTKTSAYGRPDEIKMNAILAYHAIYDSFFRNKEIEEKLLPALLPQMVAGPESGTTYSAFRLGVNDADYTATSDDQLLNMTNTLPLLDSIALANMQNPIIAKNRFTELNYLAGGSAWSGFENMLSAHAQAISENRVIASQLKQGTNRDILLKLWNANNHDKTDPLLLGYYKWEQGIQQVTATANTGGDNTNGDIGDVGGQSIVRKQGTLVYDLEIDEPCMIMVLAVANYPLTFTKYHNYYEWDAESGEYEIGLEEKPDTELYARQFNPQTAFEHKVLGYQRTWDYLRETENKVLGEFRDNMAHWCYTTERPLGALKGALSRQSIKSQYDPFLNTLTTKEDAFLSEFMFQIDELRPIKPYGETLDVLTNPMEE